VLGFALGAGLAAWVVEETVEKRFAPDLRMAPADAARLSFGDHAARRYHAVRDAARWTALATAGSFGGLVAGSLGAAGGLIGRNRVRLGIMCAVGAAVGAIAALAADALLLPIFFRHEDWAIANREPLEMTPALLVRGGLLSVSGLVSGIALGAGMGGLRRSVYAGLGGVVGGALAMVAYEFVGAVAFPGIETSQPVPPALGLRFAASCGSAMLIAAAAFVAAQQVAVNDDTRETAPSIAS
jgi:hypothetical protein